MKFPIVFLGLLFLAISPNVDAKTFTDDCAVAKELRQYGMPENQLRDWVCLIAAESTRRTTATNKNSNGSTDYGLFQINSKYWCGQGRIGGDCKIRCEDLLNDNIADDVKCAKLIYRRHQFSAWYGWKSKCNGKKLPDLSKC